MSFVSSSVYWVLSGMNVARKFLIQDGLFKVSYPWIIQVPQTLMAYGGP